MKQNKYKAKKTNGYDSKKESNRARDLKNLESAGAISNLMEQVSFEIVPKQDGERAVKYIADFTYTENGSYIVEDVKSDYTRKLSLYIVKRKLMKWVHGITIRET